jgi:hypothetical protein
VARSPPRLNLTKQIGVDREFFATADEGAD